MGDAQPGGTHAVVNSSPTPIAAIPFRSGGAETLVLRASGLRRPPRAAIPARVSTDWYELTIVVADAAEELATAALFELETTGVRSESEGGRTTLFAYFTEAPTPEAVTLVCASHGVVPVAQSTRPLAPEDVDWSENWKLHFAPRAVGDSFFVCPPWSQEAPDGRLALVVNPAMAFGTGQHATTRGCMVLLERACRDGSIDTAADLGTGSGVLAIALAQLGVRRIYAVDNDPQARASTAENLLLNGIADQVTIGTNIDDIDAPIDLFVANLFADLLVELAPEIVRRCSPTATVVCSGMLEQDGSRVLTRFAELGWEPTSRQVESPWFSVSLRRRTH